MSTFKLSPDDPRLTAYALGELQGEERAAVETALRDDPVAQAAVDEIRATVARLEFALASEPLEPAAPEPRTEVYKPKGKVLRFPQVYYLVGGLAAACFAVFVALRPQPQPAASKHYVPVALAPAPAPQNVAAPAMADATNAQAMAPSAQLDPNPAPQTPPPATMVPSGLIAQSEFAERRAKNEPAGSPVIYSAQELKAKEASARVDAMRRARNEATMKLTTFGFSDKKDVGVLGGSRPAALAGAPANTEAYAYRRDNDFVGTVENPLSTFSVDVDTASYANVRRLLQGGRLPPPDAVRVEEMVNYFPYHYAPPSGDVPFAASMEVAEAPWAPTHRLVRIGLKGREVSTMARAAANLVFLIDVSGSMNEPTKLPLVKEAMRLLVGKLRADDRVAIVVYAGQSGMALASTPVAKSRDILAALDALAPGGSTNGAMGIQLAYDIAKANLVPGGINRVILCTDGDFNVGLTSEGELTRLISEKAKSGVFLTALGFGMGNYKDAMLEQLADKGNGNYGYIDTRREAEKLLVEQVNGTLVTIAKDVKLQVEFNPAQVASYRLIGYENRLLQKEDFNNDAIDAGEIGAGHTVTALYEIVPVGLAETTASGAPAVDELKYQNPKAEVQDSKSNELLTLKVRYKEPAGAVSRKLEFPLVDTGARFADASPDFKFAAAVAEFGMILRDSPHKGSGTLPDVLAWADAGTVDDTGGYRGEFTELVRQAETLVR